MAKKEENRDAVEDAAVSEPSADALADAPVEVPADEAPAPTPEAVSEPAPVPELAEPITVSGPEIEDQVRKDYAEGKVNHQYLADKYRFSLDEIRRILDDHDLDPTFEQMRPPRVIE